MLQSDKIKRWFITLSYRGTFIFMSVNDQKNSQVKIKINNRQEYTHVLMETNRPWSVETGLLLFRQRMEDHGFLHSHDTENIYIWNKWRYFQTDEEKTKRWENWRWALGPLEVHFLDYLLSTEPETIKLINKYFRSFLLKKVAKQNQIFYTNKIEFFSLFCWKVFSIWVLFSVLGLNFLFMKVQLKRICIYVSLGHLWAVFVTGTNLQKTELRRLLIYPRNHSSMNLPP